MRSITKATALYFGVINSEPVACLDSQILLRSVPWSSIPDMNIR